MNMATIPMMVNRICLARNQEESWNWDREWNDEETHVNWRGIIIWALVIYFLFFRRKRHRR